MPRPFKCPLSSGREPTETGAAASGIRDGPLAFIDVWLDFICPFSYVQLPIFEELHARYGNRVVFRWRAFEISPDPEPSLNLRANALLSICVEKVFPIALERGVELRLPKHIPRTRKAFETAFAARRFGKFDIVQRAIFRGFFVNGIDIGDPSALLGIAMSCGMDHVSLSALLGAGSFVTDVVADRELAAVVGLTGVPFSIVSRAEGDILDPKSASVAIRGTAPVEHYEAALEKLLPGGLPKQAA